MLRGPGAGCTLVSRRKGDDMPTSGARSKTVTGLVAVAVVSALVGGSGVWLWQRGTIAALRTEAAARERTIDDLASRVGSLTDELDATNSDERPSEEPSTPATSSTPAKPTIAKQFTYIAKITTSGGVTKLVADYAQMLTGDEAAAAAAAHGDESPPPSDYYLVNDNSKLRTLAVDDGATVRLTTKSDGTVDPDGYPVTLAEFVTLYRDNDLVAHAPYNITLTDGRVTAIAEQYLP